MGCKMFSKRKPEPKYLSGDIAKRKAILDSIKTRGDKVGQARGLADKLAGMVAHDELAISLTRNEVQEIIWTLNNVARHE